MNYIVYVVFRGFAMFLAILPFRILYAVSGTCAFLLYNVIRYRKSVVMENLLRSFPEKNPESLKLIARKYYTHLCDTFFESIKGFSVKPESLTKRYLCVNPEITYPYFEAGQDVIIALSHYGNWEWGTQVAATYFRHQPATFYKPLSNPYINNYVNYLRSRRNMELLSIYETHRIANGNKTPRVYFMVSDQSPNSAKKAEWVRFLNQDTACMRGVETYARLYNLPVFYLYVKKVRRGFYRVKLDKICLVPAVSPKGEITARYMERLEKEIVHKPEYWLWSHRRWKKKRHAVTVPELVLHES